MEEAKFQEVVAAARSGQRRALTTLYGAYNPMLTRFLRAQAPEAHEDLAHDTWLAVAPRLSKFRGDERAFRLLLLTVAREESARRREAIHELPTTFMAHGALDDTVDTFGDATVADAALAQMLAGLKPVHAEILLLRVVGGLTADETAALVGKSPGAVRVIQHRALRQLAERLSGEKVGS
jgi:RNA polymerase sigma-70 factor (ECF subfamily)